MVLVFLWKPAILITLCMEVCILQNAVVGDKSTKDSSLCEDGWEHYDRYCYKMSEDELDWRAAAQSCRNMGGKLTSIHSKEQNDFLEKFRNASYRMFWYIGLHDHEVDGQYVWDDGSDINYTNWAISEPDGDYFMSGDCVVASFRYASSWGEWIVVPCSAKTYYVCQKEILTTISTSKWIDESPVTSTVNRNKGNADSYVSTNINAINSGSHGFASVRTVITALIAVGVLYAFYGRTYFL